MVIERDDEMRTLPTLLTIIYRMRAEGDDYPPPRVGSDDAAYSAWLTGEQVLARWIGQTAGGVVGHVLLAAPGDYLVEFLSSIGCSSPTDRFVEVGRLFVDPGVRSQGVGRSLLLAATSEAESRHLLPALVVRNAGDAAMHLYRAQGYTEAGLLPSGNFRVFLRNS